MKKIIITMLALGSIPAFAADMGVMRDVKLGIGGVLNADVAVSQATDRLKCAELESDLIVTEPARSEAQKHDFRILGFVTPTCELTNAMAHIWSCKTTAISQPLNQ